MASILPSIVDRWRAFRNGRKRYTGQVLLFDGGRRPVRQVIAEVYGDTREEMLRRKHAVCTLLKKLEIDQ